MSAKKLKELRRHEQEIHGYSTSSRWYTGLSNAIHFLERAEAATDALDRFRDAWSAAYNLAMLHSKPGEEEYKSFGRWITSLLDVPAVLRVFHDPNIPFPQFQTDLAKAKKTLLKKQGLQELDIWTAKQRTPEKACRYFLTIIRDIRNTCSHPSFNPKAGAVKKALKLAGDCLMPLTMAAIQTMIERPAPGTTGKTTAYRFFLWPFLKNSDSFFSDYYLERLFPDEELGAFPESEAQYHLKTLAKQMKSTDLMAAGADETREQWCLPVLFSVLRADARRNVRIVTEAGVFEPSCVFVNAGVNGNLKAEYQGKAAGQDLACLVWVLPWRTSPDAISTDPAFPDLPVMEIAHRALNQSDVPWAVITNGWQLRLLSKGTAHKPRCFLEVNLQDIADRRQENDALLAFRYFQGLFSGDAFTDRDEQDRTRLDRVQLESERHGKEIGDELKENVYHALELLGDGFLHYLLGINAQAQNTCRLKPAYSGEQDALAPMSFEPAALAPGILDAIYHESLSLMYRLLFLFYAESRNMLPMEDEMYRETYSLEALRDEIISVRDDPDPKRFFGEGTTNLWQRLRELFGFVNQGWGNLIPAYNGGLFDPEQHEFLERCAVPDSFLAQAIDLLSRTRPRSGQERGSGRKKFTYRDLDIRHLGSIYEGILEYTPQIADQELVIIKRGSGAKAFEEYVSAADLTAKEKKDFKAWQEAVAEDPEFPKLPRSCKISGKIEPGQYFLVYGGRDSKRKSSGSYYTPDYIVQYIVENTLFPLLRGECRQLKGSGRANSPLEGGQGGVFPSREGSGVGHSPLEKKHSDSPLEGGQGGVSPLSSEEILQLKVLDPAMGSGHFLVAATEYLARAYGEALIREGKDEDGIMSDDEFTRYKRMVAERCIYGVDINPMAVELAKLSMWLFTMDKGRPLSFLNHHLKCGNSLIGAWIEDLGTLPEFDKKGRPKKRQPKKSAQQNLFEYKFKAKLPLMIKDLFGIMQQETLSPKDIEAKKALDHAVEAMKRPFKAIADAWVGTFFGEEAKDYDALLLNPDQARERESKAAEEQRFFHWELEFPEVWFDEKGRNLARPGFNVIIGNPPYVFARETLKKVEKTFYANRFEKTTKDKPNLYVMFMELSVELTKKYGQVGIIVPNAWLGVDSAEPLRDMLLSDAPPRICVVCLYPVFEQVGVEPAVLCFARRHESDICSCKVQLNSKDFGKNLYETSIARWRKTPKKNFAVFTSMQAGKLIDDIINKCVPLEKLTNVKAALQAYEVGKGTPPQSVEDVKNHVFDRIEKDSPDTHQYLEGSNVIRYNIKWAGSWLYYGHWLSQPRDISIFSKERVLVREVTGQYPRMLIAAPTNELYLNNKSIINIVCDKRREISAWLVTGILNSKLGSFIFKHTGVKANRGLFPKVVIADLRSFPIPKELDETIVKQIEASVSSMCEVVNRSGQEDQKLQDKCDRFIYELYNLTSKDIEIIENEGDVTIGIA